jgi:N-acetylmuramoyl-L-alanine amidase
MFPARLRPLLTAGVLAGILAGCATQPVRETSAPEPEPEPPAQAQTALTNVQPIPPPPANAAPDLATTQLAPEPALAPPPTQPPDAGAAISNHSMEGWVALQRWCATNGTLELTRLPGMTIPTFSVRTSRGTLILRAGSQITTWNGMELRLGYAPQMISGQPYIYSLELRKTLQPLLLPGSLSLRNTDRPVLVLDPGHGGEDAGTSSVLDSRREKDFTLDWALRVRRILCTNGWLVHLTRAADTSLALSNRVTFAEERQADLFVSLHFNSAGRNRAESGLETYCLTPAGLPSNLTRGSGDDPALSFPNNAFDQQNLELALGIHRAVLQVNGYHDRGVRRARFPGVLRNQNRPAILVEGGYLSNPREAGLISDPAYREKLAEAVAVALQNALRAARAVARNAAPASPSAAAAPAASPGGASQALSQNLP